MSYKISENAHEKIVYIIHYANSTFDDYTNSSKELIDILRLKKFRKVVFETLIEPTNISEPDLYHLVKQTAESAPPGILIAVVVNMCNPEQNNLHFLEIVAYNRALNLKVFDNKHDAKHWLENN